jgi:hypothetical protein
VTSICKTEEVQQADAPSTVHHEELIATLRRDRPDLAPAAWRMVKAAERYRELFDYVDIAVAHRSGDHPSLRAPITDPADVEVTFGNVWGIPEDDTRTLTLLASETLHHVRTALDYCAYYAVWADTGIRNDHTKFPLVTQNKNWRKELANSLPRVTHTHARWIEEVQPFKGVEWSAHLVEMSNRDKHRVAVDVVACYGFNFDLARRYLDPEGDPNHIGYQVEDVTISFRLSDALGSRSKDAHLEVTGTLEGIIHGAANLLNNFLVEAGHNPLTIESR